MQKFYTAANHNVIRLFQKENISFPMTKKVMLDKIGKSMVQVDFDKSITIEEYCKDIKIDTFANKCQFFNALIGSNFKL